MIIELTGLPGSGKSTLCPLLFSSLRHIYPQLQIFLKKDLQHELKKYPLRRLKAGIKIFFSARHICNLIHIFFVPRTLGESFTASKLYINTISVYSYYQRYYDTESTLLLIDEGYVHRVYSSFVTLRYTPSSSFLAKYFTTYLSKQLTIELYVDFSTCLDRLRLRGFPLRFFNLSMSDKASFLNNMAMTRSLFPSCIISKSFDSSVPLTNLAPQISFFISTQINSRE